MSLQDVVIPSSQTPLQGCLALPDGPGPHPGVVVIHEIYGLNDNIRDITGRLAVEGYASLAVDLFSGRNRTLCMARLMAGSLTGRSAHVVSELRAGADFLTARPEVDAQRIGVVGFCMGGGLAITWGCRDQRLRAIAPFYGTNPRPLAAARRLCPVVGSYPGKDFTARSGRKLDARLETYGIVHDIKVYPGRGTRSSTTRARPTTPRHRPTPGSASSRFSPSTCALSGPPPRRNPPRKLLSKAS